MSGFLIAAFWVFITGIIVFYLVFWCRRLALRRKKMTHIRRVMAFQVADELILLEYNTMKRFSLLTAYIVISLVGLTPAGATAAMDGALSLVSSDDNVFTVTPIEGGLFRVDFVGVGQASLKVSADADLGDGVRSISHEYLFEVYDPSTEVDHFDLSILEVHQREATATDNAGASETGAVDDAAENTAEATA